ncbi:hypothetical protein KJ877_02095 [bacterium]|nr:hypothetical protein [bacterium]
MYDVTKMDAVAKTLNSFGRDCAITVALKIADDSCKMDAYEKSIFLLLYDALTHKESKLFESDVYEIIAQARNNPNAQIYSKVKTLRESAMDKISRPKMKEFKAYIRKRLA